MEQNTKLTPVALTPTAQAAVARLPDDLFAVDGHICRSWSDAIAALAKALGVERKPRKTTAGTGKPPERVAK